MKKGSILAIVLAITAMLLTGCEGGNVSKSTDGVVNGTNGTGTATVPPGQAIPPADPEHHRPHRGAGGATESATNGTHGNEATGSTSGATNGATEHTGATGESQGESRTESTGR